MSIISQFAKELSEILKEQDRARAEKIKEVHAALKETQEEAEKAKEVYVWLLRDGKIEKVRLLYPAYTEECLRKNGYYVVGGIQKAFHFRIQDEGVTWFRTEKAALEAQKKAQAKGLGFSTVSYKASDCLISLRRAIEMVRQAAAGEVGAGWKEYSPRALATNTVEIAVDNLKELPRHPIPQGKMVPLKTAIEWLVENGYYWSAHAIEERFAKD